MELLSIHDLKELDFNTRINQGKYESTVIYFIDSSSIKKILKKFQEY